MFERMFLVHVHSGVLSPRDWTSSSVSSTAHRGESTLLPAELDPSHKPSTHRWSQSELTDGMTLRIKLITVPDKDIYFNHGTDLLGYKLKVQ
mgnify:CR=1 FL=1